MTTQYRYSVFNFNLIDKVTKLIKQEIPLNNLQKNIQITAKTRSTYINTIPNFDAENTWLQEVGTWVDNALETPNIPTQIQETTPLSPRAKKFLEEIDKIMSQEFTASPSVKKYTIPVLDTDQPLLKKAFDHLDKTFQEKYQRMLDEC